ncbi:MAG: riboflavin biosynthesis protein RibF [Vampirovibrionales bacterium]|nr:riboflavin biosynthesis protein RibF [Vampirovibrionales bacterium]
MKITRHHEDLQLAQSACALGMFDGVHVGHRMVLENAIREARILSETHHSTIPSVVFSFSDHPQQLLAKTPTALLSSLDERLAMFEQLGFDHALILDFDPWLRNLSPKAFVDKVLLNTLGAKHVSVGYDYRFGKDKTGTGDTLSTLGAEKGFGVTVIEPVKRIENAQIASSTLIRKLLTYGDITAANQLLGRPYQLSGTVVEGYQRGRKLGFPTANLNISQQRIVPAIGTYSGIASLKSPTSGIEKKYTALCNIGICPTFNNQDQPDKEPQSDESKPLCRLEVYLLDYSGPEFYGETLSFNFYERLRDEMAFPSLEALIAQIHSDVAHVRQNAVLDGKMTHIAQEAGYSI